MIAEWFNVESEYKINSKRTCSCMVKINAVLCIVFHFCIYQGFCCKMNLYVGPAPLYYRINNIYLKSYL